MHRQHAVDRVRLMSRQPRQALRRAVGARQSQHRLHDPEQPGINLDPIRRHVLAIPADHPALGGREKHAIPAGDRAAGDARFQRRQIPRIAQHIELKRQQRLFDLRARQIDERAVEPVKQVRMEIVFFKQRGDQLRTIQAGIDASQVSPQLQVAIEQLPLGQRRQLALGCMGKDGISDIKQIHAAAELAGAGLGLAMGPFGDNAQQPMLAREQ